MKLIKKEMNSNKYAIVADCFIKIFAAIMLTIAATTRQQYSFYTLLRWTIMASCIYFLFLAIKVKQNGLIILYITVAIIFNPFKIIWFQKQTWHLIDLALSVVFVAIALYNLKQTLNNK